MKEFSKPYAVTFDVETTGLDKKKDSIIQFAAIKTDLKTNKIVDELDLLIQPKGDYQISLGAYFKHGISPKTLKDKPHFADVADRIAGFFGPDCVVITYNGCSFDISFLAIEFERIGISFSLLGFELYDSFLEEKRRRGNTLEETFQRYYGQTMEQKGLRAHNALSDVKATFMVFVAQQKEKEFGPEEVITEDNTIKLMEFQGKILPCFTAGKYRTVPVDVVKKIDKNYLEWILTDRCSYSPSAKRFVRDKLNED